MKNFEVFDLLRYFRNAKKKDGTLFPILGEDALALTASLSYLLEDTNFCIKAYSGTGKTVLMEAIANLLPPHFVHTVEHMSETAIWYDHEKINEARFIIIPEAQKLPEGVMEVIKTWADGRAATRKVTDVTTKYPRSQILNSKYVLMAVAVENDKGISMFDAELERRCMIMHTNPTVKQTERVIKHKLQYSAVPQSNMCGMDDDEVKALRKHLITAIQERDEDDATIIKNPCAPFLFDAIPSAFPVSRSKVQYLLRLISAIGRFYPHEIMRTERDGIKYGLLTPKHNWLGLRIYLNHFVEECLHMPSHGTDILKLFPETRLDRFGMADSETVKMSEIELKKAAKAAGLPFTKLKPVISGLMMTGFLEMDDDGKRQLFYKSPLLTEPASKINWNDLIEETEELIRKEWPEVSSEYIGRNCGSVEIVDPFDGHHIVVGKGTKKIKTEELPEGEIKELTKGPMKPSIKELIGSQFQHELVHPAIFKSLYDAGFKDYQSFLMGAKGDYDEEEYKTIKHYYLRENAST